jgi:hypothetical protein
MVQQIERTTDKPVSEMTCEELRELFAWYDFKDPLGHPLVNCQEFIELIERVTADAASMV